METPESNQNFQEVSARLGAEVRRLRSAAKLTQQALADRAYYSRSYISLIEIGREHPSAEAIDRIAKALHDDGTLRVLHRQTAAHRRQGVVAPVQFSSISHTTQLESPGIAGRLVDPEAVASLRVLLIEYAKIDNLLGPRSLVAVLAAQLNFISELLPASSGELRVELLRLAAWYAEFTGWLYQDAGSPIESARYLDRAMDWAQEADDPLMVSYVLMRRSNIASEMAQGPRALGLARAALRNADQITPRARALALRQEARGQVLAGNELSAARALEQARIEAASGQGDSYGDAVLTGYCTPAYIEMEAADCWLQLKKPGKAVAIFEQGLAAWPEHFQRDRGLHLARLAGAHAANLHPEEACSIAHQALSIAHTTGSGRARAELQSLPGRLTRWASSRAVHELREAVTALP